MLLALLQRRATLNSIDYNFNNYPNEQTNLAIIAILRRNPINQSSSYQPYHQTNTSSCQRASRLQSQMSHIIFNPGTWFPRSARWIRNPANPEDHLPHSIWAEIEIDNDDKM